MVLKDPNEIPQGAHVKKIYGLTGILGLNRIGKFRLGLENTKAGIFRADRQTGKVKTARGVFYMQWAPRTPNQVATAGIFKDGMAAWALLTPEQKQEYNNRAKKYHLEGVNIFMREWMRSH